jgi:hypothetical protein
VDVRILTTVATKTAVSAVLLYAGSAKLLDTSGFADVVRGFALLPRKVVGGFARALPVAEVLVGMGMLAGIFSDWIVLSWAGAASATLFSMFAGAIAINLLRGRSDISCGCFGKKNHKLSWVLVGRASACLLISILTLPPFAASVAREGLRDRVVLTLTGSGLVAAVWLGRFIVSTASAAFDFPSF